MPVAAVCAFRHGLSESFGSITLARGDWAAAKVTDNSLVHEAQRLSLKPRLAFAGAQFTDQFEIVDPLGHIEFVNDILPGRVADALLTGRLTGHAQASPGPLIARINRHFADLHPPLKTVMAFFQQNLGAPGANAAAAGGTDAQERLAVGTWFL